MCGRFSLSQSPEEMLDRLHILLLESVSLRPRYNIAPTQPVLTIFETEAGERRAGEFRWGLIPHWVKDIKTFKRNLINARAETAAEKPAFRDSFLRRRCAIPADGFFEWKRIGDRRKQPYRITLADGSLFAFAGLWDRWTSPTGETIFSCTILTTTPNELVAHIHNRMPVILDQETIPDWIDRNVDPRDLTPLLTPYPAGEMTAYPVSSLVNSPRNDGPQVIQAIKN